MALKKNKETISNSPKTEKKKEKKPFFSFGKKKKEEEVTLQIPQEGTELTFDINAEEEKPKKKKKAMSQKTKILLIIVSIVGIGILYYFLVYQAITTEMKNYSTENLEVELTQTESKIKKQNDMKAYIDSGQKSEFGTVEVYSNLSNDIAALGDILHDANNVAITWSDPTLTGKIVRRQVQIKFETDDYNKVMDYLAKIRVLKYRFLFGDVQISAKTKETFGSTEKISVVAKGVIYEIINEESNLDGLVVVAGG